MKSIEPYALFIYEQINVPKAVITVLCIELNVRIALLLLIFRAVTAEAGTSPARTDRYYCCFHGNEAFRTSVIILSDCNMPHPPS
ncbi:hypothetical protein KDK_54780 [Dictyobacter kobayashii]|uniref:Uncharacterized protein n=1 Tax=Dictyobacter kobayashii TaxID=2014872 RepID=A0A402ARF7_9CHLR|nr:hypothetical protein KDK_54780 [Dictyobacter kobayashii]